MPLTHVKRWKNGKWESVTIDQMRNEHRYGGISANSGLLMCDLCNKYVIMTESGQVDSYFRHNNADDYKDCPERSIGTGGSGYTSLDKETKGLPIRINVNSSGGYMLSIGFPALQIIGQITEKIIIETSNGDRYVYGADRLSGYGTVYLGVGNSPSKRYQIKIGELQKKSPDIYYWPSSITGINKKALFLKSTGRMLPTGSDICIKESYYFLSRSSCWTCEGVSSKRIGYSSGYFLYEIRIEESTFSTVKFAIDVLEHRLVDLKMTISFLWPVVIKDPYIVYHREQTQFAFVTSDDAIYKLYPYSSIPYEKLSDGSLLRLTCVGREQLLTIGRTRNILDYTYLWISDFNIEKQYSLPDDPYPLAEEQSNYIKGKRLAFIPKFNGRLVVEKNGWTERVCELNAGILFELDKINKTFTYKIYYGQDCIWQSDCSTHVRESIDVLNDRQLLSALKKCKGSVIETPEIIKTIARSMHDTPLSKQWINRRIHEGKIVTDAYKLLLSMRNNRG